MSGKHHTVETKKLMKKKQLGKRHTDLTKKKMSEQRIGKPTWMKGRRHSKKSKQKESVSQQNLWRNEEYAKKMFKKFQARPTGHELYLDFLLQNHFPDEWRYVGNGEVIIGGKCPDFINVNGKKQVIELFGEYWHKGKRIPYNRTEAGRKKVFRRIGFNALVIWSAELSDERKLIEKIRCFNES